MNISARCPITGFPVKDNVTKAKAHPPGYYYLHRDCREPVEKKITGPVLVKPIEEEVKVKKKKTDRSEYYRKWYSANREHKHQVYLSKKAKLQKAS